MQQLREAITAERHGSFIVFRDDDGIRHAVRLGAVMAISDADANRDAVLLQLPSGRFVRVLASLEEVLTWLSGAPTPMFAVPGGIGPRL